MVWSFRCAQTNKLSGPKKRSHLTTNVLGGITNNTTGNAAGSTNFYGISITVGSVPQFTLTVYGTNGSPQTNTYIFGKSGNLSGISSLVATTITGALIGSQTNNTSGNSAGATNFYGTVASSQVTGLSSNVLGNVLSYSSESNVIVDLSKYTNQIRVGLVLTLTNNTMVIFTNPAPAFTFSIDFYQNNSTNSWDRYYDTNVLRASFGGLRSFTNSAPGAWNFDSIHFGQWSNFTVLSSTNLLP